jgi:methylenetetrahydrofolate reductase (NADPH)
MHISIELVPRSNESLLAEAQMIQSRFPSVTMLNVPDLLRFPLRSWDAVALTMQHYPTSVPHLRAIDIPPTGPLPMADTLSRIGIREVIIVTGDPPQDMRRKVYPTTVVDVVRRFKRELPCIKLYAAYDPYRQGIRAERDYVTRKLDAGVDGFFTQPFFDVRLLELHAEQLEGLETFWGIAPVLSNGSKSYWEATNQVIFPREFKPTLAWNQGFAEKALTFVRKTGGSVYFMPIRVDLASYLTGLL